MATTSLTGNFIVSASGTAQTTLVITADADQLTEGLETLTLSLDGISPTVSVSVQIEDTSKALVPSYALSYSIPNFNTSYINTAQKITINGYYRQYLGRNAEPDGLASWDNSVTSGAMTLSAVATGIRNSSEAGAWDGKVTAIEHSDVIVIKLTTSNISAGTQVPYTITGINGADISNAPLTGNFIVGANGEATISLTTSEDRITEGIETVTITLNNVTPAVRTSFRIFDSSVVAGYTLSSSVNAVNEGSAVTITLTTTNVNNGTQVPFTISGTGINNSDLSASGLTWNAAANRFEGTFTINNNTASVSVNVTADAATEGTEAFNVTLSAITPTVTKTITINDTSVIQTGTGTLSVPGLIGTIANMPADPVWVAFKMVGAGGSGAGTDGGGSSGLGYSAVSNSAWSTNLNSSGVAGPGNPFTFSAPFWAPVSGPHTYIYANDNSGFFTIDNGPQITNGSFNSDSTGTVTIQAGQHTVFISCSNSGGPTGVGLQIFGPDGRRIFTTRQQSQSGGGSGGPGNYIEGIVRLPATTGPKVLRGGVGAPGKGGAVYSGASAGSEPGGLGFGLAGVSGTSVLVAAAPGGRGGRPGGSGSSGPGGAGGGASTLYCVLAQAVGQAPGVPDVINIAVAGGGGGGGGKANNQSGAAHAQLASGLNLTGNLDGQDWSGDGAGGGGGGGYGGQGGVGGPDNGAMASGGDAGTNNRNLGLTWNTWNEYIERIPTTALPGSLFSNSRLSEAYPLGKGGIGVLTDGSWSNNAATSGTQGGISVYWTTSLTAPGLNLIPAFGDASAAVTVNLPTAQDSVSGVTFYGDGTCVINGSTATWVNGTSLPGIGEWFEIKFVSSAPSNGITKGTYSSNIPENTWTVLDGNGAKGYMVTAADNSINVTVYIRKRTTGFEYSPAVYRNLGPGYNTNTWYGY
jgi:Domain of unknown function (DUF4214)